MSHTNAFILEYMGLTETIGTSEVKQLQETGNYTKSLPKPRELTDNGN